MKNFLILALALLSATLNAAPTRYADTITPQVVQRGVESKVLLKGNRLSTVTGLLTYNQGIRFLRTEPAPDSKDADTEIILVLEVDANCAIGEHLFRVRLKETLSELQTLWVSPFPCVQENNPNARDGSEVTFDGAQEVKLGTTVWGNHPGYSNFDQDFYRVELAKGDRLTAELWGSCLSNLIDASLTLYSPDRKVLFTIDDTTLRERDPFFSYIAEKAGPHYVVVHPFNDDENSDWRYALHLTNGLRPTIAYPLGGPAGKALKTTLLGDPSGDIKTEIDLPTKAERDEKAIIDIAPQGSIIPLHYKAANFPNVIEAGGDHSTPDKAQIHSGTLPIAFNGKIESEGETDWFRFKAKTGERFLVRTYAATIGSPLDPKIIIRPADGTESSINISADDSAWIDHDWAPHGRWRCKDLADPITVFEADTDGEYLIGVSDNQRMFSPLHVYRIEFQPARNRIWLQNTHDYRESMEKRDAIVIPAGSHIERTYNIVRPPITNYNGDYDIVVRGLPKGVTYSAPRLTKSSRIVQINFSAAPGTPAWAGFPEIELRPVDSSASLEGGYFHVHSRIVGRGGLCSGFYRKSRRFALAVVDPAPLAVKVTQPSSGLALNAFLDLDVEIDRSGGYDGDVVVRCLWTPPNVTASPPLTIPAGRTKASYRLTASGRASPGKHAFTLTAHESHEAVGGNITSGVGLNFVSSPPVNYEVVAPFLEITLARSAIERGKNGTITGTIKHTRELSAPATATLVNLPTGIELLNDVTIKAGQTEISFPIRATSDALLGQAGDIACHVTIKDGTQSIVQSTGVATLRIDQERK